MNVLILAAKIIYALNNEHALDNKKPKIFIFSYILVTCSYIVMLANQSDEKYTP